MADYSAILRQFSSPFAASTAVDLARTRGMGDPRLAELTPEELVEFDRYVQGFGAARGTGEGLPAPVTGAMRVLGALGTAAVGTGYEMAKAVAPPLLRAVGTVPGLEDHTPDETTSPARAAHVKELMRGYVHGALPQEGLKGFLRQLATYTQGKPGLPGIRWE